MKKVLLGILLLLVGGLVLVVFLNHPRLEFNAGTCAPLGPSNQSMLGIKQTEWVDNKTLKIKAFGSVSCGVKITKGSYRIINDTIFLEYSWKDVVVDSKGNTMVALCMCAPELNYLLKNLEKKEYKFKLTAHQEKPLLTVFKEKINKWLLGE